MGMSDKETTMYGLRERAVAFRDERDWRQFHVPKDLVLATVVEAGELAELFLWKSPDQIRDDLDSATFRGHLADEMADVLIYLLYLADVTGIDLAQAVEAKLRQNEAKYPVALARGSAQKYTEIRGPHTPSDSGRGAGVEQPGSVRP